MAAVSQQGAQGPSEVKDRRPNKEATMEEPLHKEGMNPTNNYAEDISSQFFYFWKKGSHI